MLLEAGPVAPCRGVISRGEGSVVQEDMGRKSSVLDKKYLRNHIQKPFEGENLHSLLDMLEYLINNCN